MAQLILHPTFKMPTEKAMKKTNKDWRKDNGFVSQDKPDKNYKNKCPSVISERKKAN